MKKYLVICEDYRSAHFDTYTYVFDSLDEAETDALFQWQHLTPKEQKNNHIYTAYVEDTPEFYGDDILEESPMDWCAWDCLGALEDSFDSDDKYDGFRIKTYPCEWNVQLYAASGKTHTHRINLNEMFPADEEEADYWAARNTEELFFDIDSWMYDRDLEQDLQCELEQMWRERIASYE